jgi:acetolactate synthase-1/2/3 large subunit
MGPAAAETIAAALAPPGQVSSLIVAADVSWSEAGAPGGRVPLPRRVMSSQEAILHAARLLPCPGTALLLGGLCGSERALAAAGKLTAHTGVQVLTERYTPRIAAGRGRFQPPSVPYFPEPAMALLAGVRNLILVESQAPVSFFGYPDTPSYLLPEGAAVLTLAERGQDGTAALEALVDECNAGSAVIPLITPATPAIPDGPLTANAAGAILAARMPEGAIVSDEMISAGGGVLPHFVHAAPHDRMPVTGGSIGQGLPVAVGAAFACPDRKVLALEADGSGMYTLQSLWTMAREQLDVTTVIFANRKYEILEIEMRRTGTSSFGEAAREMMDIGRPDLDWVKLSQGMGVPATRATTAEEFDHQLCAALRERGPRLIEAVVG